MYLDNGCGKEGTNNLSIPDQMAANTTRTQTIKQEAAANRCSKGKVYSTSAHSLLVTQFYIH
jgi:hypothetical protein